MTSLRTTPPSDYTGLAELVSPGCYSLFTKMEDLTPCLRHYAYPVPEKFYAILVLASNASRNPPDLEGVVPKADEPVYSVNLMRYDPSSGPDQIPT
jgi:hypothetical protein